MRAFPTSPLNVSDANVAGTVKAALGADAKAMRCYAGLVAYLDLTPDTSAQDLTEAAKSLMVATYGGEMSDYAGASTKNEACKRRATLRAGLKRALDALTASDDDGDDGTPKRATKYVTAEGLRCSDRAEFLARVTAEWDAAHGM